MKTKLFFIAAVMAMTLTCQSMQAQIKYGLHAGMNLEAQANLGELWNNVDLYQGFLIGGFVDYKIGSFLSLQTELNYQKKGGKFTSTSEGPESIVRKEFNYITVPLLIKSTFHDKGLSDNCDLELFTGPYLGFLTSAYSNIKAGSITTPVNIEDQAKRTDWGIFLGGGVSYKLGNGGAVIAELRYQMGLNEVDKQDPDLRNKGMGLTIGYRF